MRVFLTGATGFIGSHVARVLIRENCEVFALIRENANIYRIQDIRSTMHFVDGDISSPESIKSALAEIAPELCLHLAWYVEPGRCLDADENMSCLVGSLELLKLLDAVGCRRLLLAGTSIEYNTDMGYVSESSSIKPASLYGASKHALFLIAQQFAISRGWDFTTARIFNVYGPWEDTRRLVPQVIHDLLHGKHCKITKGDQIRDYLHVEDVADAIWAIACSDLQGPVNIGSSQPVSVRSVVEEIANILNCPQLLQIGGLSSRSNDYHFLCANTHLLRNKIKWMPRYSLKEGLAQTINWWKHGANWLPD